MVRTLQTRIKDYNQKAILIVGSMQNGSWISGSHEGLFSKILQ